MSVILGVIFPIASFGRKEFMTSVELQMEIMNSFWGRLCDLSDTDLMMRKRLEMEKHGNLKAINCELNRRIREL